MHPSLLSQSICIWSGIWSLDWHCAVGKFNRIFTVPARLCNAKLDWFTNRAAHKGFIGVTVGEEICTDLDYADDISLLASMLEILVLAPEILHEESSQIGLEINWSKTKLQVFDDT